MLHVQEHAYTGLAENYQKTRPTYPIEMGQVIAAFAKHVLEPGAIAIDVGSGTGLSTFFVAAALPADCIVMGIEPNADMRAQANAAIPPDRAITFIAGAADNLTVGNAQAALVTVGQAVQWFDRPKFYAEAHRALRRGGVIALFENNRDWRRSAFLEAHEAFLEAHAVRKDGSRYSRHYRDHPYAQELFRTFGNVTARQFEWERRMTQEAFLTMALSSTQVQATVERIGLDQATRLIGDYCGRFADPDGVLGVPYTTDLYMAKKATD